MQILKKIIKYFYIPISMLIFVAVNADTRTQILQRNFQAMRLHGFQGVRADKVVADMGITKGALYHHFSSKLDLGYAVVDELLAPSYLSTWRPLETARKKHLQVLVQTLEQFKQRTDDEEVKLGCPLNNLMQEMSPLDEGFRRRLGNIIEKMAYSIETGLRNRQAASTIRPDADAKQLAVFILSCIEGSYSVAKSVQSKAYFDSSIDQLITFVNGLAAK